MERLMQLQLQQQASMQYQQGMRMPGMSLAPSHALALASRASQAAVYSASVERMERAAACSMAQTMASSMAPPAPIPGNQSMSQATMLMAQAARLAAQQQQQHHQEQRQQLSQQQQQQQLQQTRQQHQQQQELIHKANGEAGAEAGAGGAEGGGKMDADSALASSFNSSFRMFYQGVVAAADGKKGGGGLGGSGASSLAPMPESLPDITIDTLHNLFENVDKNEALSASVNAAQLKETQKLLDQCRQELNSSKNVSNTFLTQAASFPNFAGSFNTMVNGSGSFGAGQLTAAADGDGSGGGGGGTGLTASRFAAAAPRADAKDEDEDEFPWDTIT
jgi:hypothetical protein